MRQEKRGEKRQGEVRRGRWMRKERRVDKIREYEKGDKMRSERETGWENEEEWKEENR